MIRINRIAYYGLTKVRDCKKYLYFIPLIVIMTVNFWRGFLFKMMEKDNLRRAMIISAITFGIGNIVNLLNGADFIPTMLQVCYAVSIGYLFVVIFYKSKSIIPCIITHMVVNATSIFAVKNDVMSYVSAAVLIVISIGYVIYLNKMLKE